VKPQQASRSFLKKRTKKLLFYIGLALRRRARQAAKSFYFFFQKEVLSSFVAVINNAGWYNLHVVDKVKFRGLVQASCPSFVQRRLAPLALA